MSRKHPVAFSLFNLSSALSFCPLRAVAQSAEPAITRLCTPKITANILVASLQQRYDAGQRSQPPITDTRNAFAWPDPPRGALKTENGYEFFASDGGWRTRQMWRREWVGNNKSGSVVTTFGTLANPLGLGDPQNVSISLSPDPAVNPNYPSYGYMGSGPVFRVPADMPGAGNLLVVYHAELPNDGLYAALGLAESSNDGLHWRTWARSFVLIRLIRWFSMASKLVTARSCLCLYRSAISDPSQLMPPPWALAKILTCWAARSACTSLICPARVGHGARCGGSLSLANALNEHL
jgi:hypothetical protein